MRPSTRPNLCGGYPMRRARSIFRSLPQPRRPRLPGGRAPAMLTSPALPTWKGASPVRHLSLLALLALVAGALPLPAQGPPAGEGFVPLFNGKNLDGWVQRGGKAKYRAEGGEIVGTT